MADEQLMQAGMLAADMYTGGGASMLTGGGGAGLAGTASSLAKGSGAGPSSATSKGEAVFDNSGWNVVFGSGSIASTSDKTTGLGGDGSSSAFSEKYIGYFIAIFGAVLLWKMTKKS